MGDRQTWQDLAPEPRPLKENEQWHVFLSYRSVNRPWVLNLYDVLTDAGFKVFLDQYVLKTGGQLIGTLEDALESSQAGILVWSTAASDSAWVKREYQVMEQLAEDREGFNFVPIRLDASELPSFAKRRVFQDFSAYPSGPNGGELLRLLHGLVGQALSPEAVRFANEQDEAAKEEQNKITAASRNKRPGKIVELFENGGLPWQTNSSLGCKAAEELTKLGKYPEAIGILQSLETMFPKAIRPRQLHALALARRGEGDDLYDAQDILGELYAAGERDPETVGIYARTWMDRYKKSNDRADLLQSRDYYLEAFEGAQDDYYTGINAAAKSVFLDTDADIAMAKEIAAKVQEIVGHEAVGGDYWMTATVAEAFLLQGKYAEAADMYAKAVAGARHESGSHLSTWLQAYRLMNILKPGDEDRAAVREAFAHLPDDPEAA